MFKTMQFSNSQVYRVQNINSYSANTSRAPVPASRPVSLNAPMVSRVHNAKPGCSACGKKVA